MSTSIGSKEVQAMDVLLHPMLIVNISDHHTREKVRIGKPQRIYGILLGTQSGRRVEIKNSFEIIINDRDSHNIDKEFLQTRLQQYSRVFENLEVLGWYATGKNIENYDVRIHQQVEQYNETPFFLLLNPDFSPDSKELPIALLETVLKGGGDDKPNVLFQKVAYRIETTEAERIGVDTLQNVSAGGKSLLTSHLAMLHSAIKMLNIRIKSIVQFLKATQGGQLKERDEAVLRQINALIHQIPAINTDKFKEDFLTEYNDALLVTYLATITRTSHALNEMLEKFNIAYDKQSRRRGFM